MILTAREEIEDRVRGLDLGADDCVAKPSSIDELAARLRARLRPRSNVAARLTVGELQLDLIGWIVTERGVGYRFVDPNTAARTPGAADPRRSAQL